MNEDSRDLSRAFTDLEARFLIVGAYAVSAHAEPRATVDYAGVPCHVIGREALVANKRLLGRAKDRADLELLERHRKDR